MNKDPFKEYIKEYIRESEPAKREKGYAWHTAIGLQKVDGLKTSEYLMHTAVRNIEGEISFEEANALLQTYYERDYNIIHETTEYLEVFLRNLLLNENHPLHNRTLHISGTFKETAKPDIEAKTAKHILKLREAFPGQMIFGRSDVMEVIDVKPSRASELLKNLMEHRIIEPVSGYGKGKYRFR